MMFNISPLSNPDAFCVDVWDGGRFPIYIRGFASLGAALHFIDNFDPQERNVDGSWTR